MNTQKEVEGYHFHVYTRYFGKRWGSSPMVFCNVFEKLLKIALDEIVCRMTFPSREANCFPWDK